MVETTTGVFLLSTLFLVAVTTTSSKPNWSSIKVKFKTFFSVDKKFIVFVIFL